MKKTLAWVPHNRTSASDFTGGLRKGGTTSISSREVDNMAKLAGFSNSREAAWGSNDMFRFQLVLGGPGGKLWKGPDFLAGSTRVENTVTQRVHSVRILPSTKGIPS